MRLTRGKLSENSERYVRNIFPSCELCVHTHACLLKTTSQNRYLRKFQKRHIFHHRRTFWTEFLFSKSQFTTTAFRRPRRLFEERSLLSTANTEDDLSIVLQELKNEKKMYMNKNTLRDFPVM